MSNSIRLRPYSCLRVDNVPMPARRRNLSIAGALILGALSASGCAQRVQAKTPAPAPVEVAPPLMTPDPPSRLKVPTPIDSVPATAPAAEKPAPPSAARPKPSAPPPATSPPPASAETTTPPVIQAGAGVEQQARERLQNAQRDLNRVQRSSLSPDAREQYDTATRFVRMAEDAIKLKNFVYASYCADKAATLASLLVKAGGPPRA